MITLLTRWLEGKLYKNDSEACSEVHVFYNNLNLPRISLLLRAANSNWCRNLAPQIRSYIVFPLAWRADIEPQSNIYLFDKSDQNYLKSQPLDIIL